PGGARRSRDRGLAGGGAAGRDPGQLVPAHRGCGGVLPERADRGVDMSRLRAGLAVAAVVLAAAGCGDPQLWARYRAERDFWRARRLVERIELNPRVARAAEFARPAPAALPRRPGRTPGSSGASRWSTR